MINKGLSHLSHTRFGLPHDYHDSHAGPLSQAHSAYGWIHPSTFTDALGCGFADDWSCGHGWRCHGCSYVLRRFRCALERPWSVRCGVLSVH